MSDTDAEKETDPGVFEDPADVEQRDNSEPLDHLAVDDAESQGAKASKDLHDGETDAEAVDQPKP
jgi:hypothetical protein